MPFSSNDSENAHHLLLLKFYYCNHLLDNNAQLTYIILLSLSKWLPSLRRIMLFRKVHKSWCSLYTLFLKPRHQSRAWPHFTPAPLCPSKLTWSNRKTKNLMLLHEKRFHEASSTETWFTISIYIVYFPT